MTFPGRIQGAAYLLDKPPGLTSRRAAARVAKHWEYSKFGHSGTLDPDATGLLIVLMGKATRLSRYLLSSSKTYSFGIELGIRTDTDDTGGSVLERSPVEGVSEDHILVALKGLTGTVMQKVPDYSAVRVDGRRAYSLAREGSTPDTPFREVLVKDWTLHGWDGVRALLSVTVSSGTYVRALARDIGDELGTGAAAFDIRRTAIDGFSLEEASREFDDAGSLISMPRVMRGFETRTLDPGEAETVSHGGSVAGIQVGVVTLIDTGGRLLAVAEGDGSLLRPQCVLLER